MQGESQRRDYMPESFEDGVTYGRTVQSSLHGKHKPTSVTRCSISAGEDKHTTREMRV